MELKELVKAVPALTPGDPCPFCEGTGRVTTAEQVKTYQTFVIATQLAEIMKDHDRRD